LAEGVHDFFHQYRPGIASHKNNAYNIMSGIIFMILAIFGRTEKRFN
jgi:hypothetical protein